MNQSSFRDLCRETSALMGIEDIDLLGTEGYLEIASVPIAVIFDEDFMPDRIFCYVDIGPVEDLQRLRVYENLLELNLLSGTKTQGVYSIDPSSRHVIFAVQLMDPDAMHPKKFMHQLEIYSKQALRLQEIFIKETENPDFKELVEEFFGLRHNVEIHKLA